MAVTRKTTIRSFNGTDWDSIYLSTSADIVSLGSAIAAIRDDTELDFTTTFSADSTVLALLTKVVKRLATYDAVTIPGIKDGSLMTSYPVAKLTGRASFNNLPTNVKGDIITVASETEKAALTASDVAVGDIVKVAGASVYGVQAIDGSTITYVKLTDESATLDWTKLTNIPSELTHTAAEASSGTKMYVTNAVLTGDLVASSAGSTDAGKAVKLDANGKLGFSITGDAATLESHGASYFGTAQDVSDINTEIGERGYASAQSEGYEEGDTIRSGMKGDIQTIQEFLDAIDATKVTRGVLPLSVIPAAAVEKLKVVRNDTARFALTTSDVQIGDTVKVQEDAQGNPDPKMYYVVDDTKLNSADGYEIYTAGTASTVDWGGVTNTPTTLSGYGITDAVNSSDVVETAAAGKILKLDSNGKLPTSITGDAATLGGNAPAYYATATALTALDTFVGHAASGQDPATGLVARIVALETTVGDASSGLVKDVADLRTDVGVNTSGSESGIFLAIKNLEAGTSITSLAVSKLSGVIARANLPADVSGQIITTYATLAAALVGLTTTTAHKGDLLKTTDGKVYVLNDADPTVEANWVNIVDIANTNIAWTKLTGIPSVLTHTSSEAADGSKMYVTNAVLTGDLVASSSGSTDAGKAVKLDANGKLGFDITGDAATLGGHADSYFATASDLAEASLYTLRIVNSTDDVQNASIGQMVLVPVTVS